ncbi:MAG: radical SAM family heme chaperone HemW [Candidatus Omnitrophica bacterium]|nr:radical SAM family heme chaperone HemW [Candidatus Omnitrophota bacterium]MDD5574364.1 radical SAM family heme chaperone HemW [Candidatus Omnitrophota bacterium]
MDLSLYIHIPFCKSKCFYCSFASYAGQEDLIDAYLDALGREASRYGRPDCSTVYIGGGTPTHLSGVQLEKLLKIVNDNFSRGKDSEFTIEANPATFDAHKAKLLRRSGVNRVSLGVQSLRDENLRWLGRPHSAAEAMEGYRILREAGFKNINLDFIYALPHQTQDELKEGLKEIEALGSEHLSLYALSVEEGTELYHRQVQPLEPDRQADDYRMVVAFLKACGLLQYEVSNFAREGYLCEHNAHYWRAGDYIGLGVSAHSHIMGHRFWNVSGVSEYISLMNEKGFAREGEEMLTPRERLREAFLIGLRLCEGVWLKGLEDRFGVSLEEHERSLVKQLIQEGLLEEYAGVIRATPQGMLVLDEICSQLS